MVQERAKAKSLKVILAVCVCVSLYGNRLLLLLLYILEVFLDVKKDKQVMKIVAASRHWEEEVAW